MPQISTFPRRTFTVIPTCLSVIPSTSLSFHHLSVIPSAARNLKSITARPDGQSHACTVTKNENSVRTPYVSFTLGQTL